jgi:hypothetical protein
LEYALEVSKYSFVFLNNKNNFCQYWSRCSSVNFFSLVSASRNNIKNKRNQLFLMHINREPTIIYDSLYRKIDLISNIYIHTYHSRFIPDGVAEVSQIFLRDTHVLPKLVSYEEHCRLSCGFAHAREIGPHAWHPQRIISYVYLFVKCDKHGVSDVRDAECCVGRYPAAKHPNA